MTWIALLAAAFGLALAAANGANDVGKGVATLAGSRVAGIRRALWWGTGWTLGGTVGGALWGGALLSAFGSGLWCGGAPTDAAALATLAAATVWVVGATAAGFPVSTTHALVGALAGVGAAAYGFGSVRWAEVGSRVALPLLLAPLAGVVAGGVLRRLARLAPGGATRASLDCLCAEVVPAPAPVFAGEPATAHLAGIPGLRLSLAPSAVCAAHGPAAARFSVDALQWMTSGLTSFARGMNDSPKLVAVVLGVPALAASGASLSLTFALVAVGMGVGGILAGLRVTRVLADGVTPLDRVDGFAASLGTAGLVGAGAVLGLPMSTTHVACGALVGTGMQREERTVNRRAVRGFLLAWVVTAPGSALLGAACLVLTRGLPSLGTGTP
ncbi:MAG: inorganic phosphate transporter [Planctomycetales bacterium]|nr:inorganic phosphate transporter [Planctomycetales bacterium]